MKIRDLRQHEGETEYDFGHSVLTADSRIPGVFSQAAQVVTFIEGLSEAVSAGGTRDRQVSPQTYETFHAVMELTNSHGIVERARFPADRKSKIPVKGVLVVGQERLSSPTTSSRDTRITGSGDGAALATEGGTMMSPSTTPSFATYTTSHVTPTRSVPER